MTTPAADRLPLTRASDERMLAGVCGGLATHLGFPVLGVRIAMLIFALLGGAGGLFYVWLWITVPPEGETDGIVPLRRALTKPATGQTSYSAAPLREDRVDQLGPQTRETRSTPDFSVPTSSVPVRVASASGEPPAATHAAEAPQRRTKWPVAELLLGTCLVLVGVLLVLQQLGVELQLTVILPGLAVLVGVGLTWWQIADRERPDRNQLPRVLAALALVAVGVLMFFVTSDAPSTWTVITAALAVLAGVALAIAPWLLRLNRELIAERAGHAREAERSEIAAHLHDSVLQTLALIQQRSEPGSEVARLARGQERELRDWLFRAGDGGAQTPRESLASELRAHAAVLENDHAVRFETVSVGEEVVAPEAIVAAAKEAMLNAARHAGGNVTVYAEVSPYRVAIDVTDRGPGLDLNALPDGRMGVRESILGRMSRAGGSANIVAGPGGTGTSIRLEMPREHVSVPEASGGTV
ncbi:ATP-binding protein [Leucobacter denitrificans]|uniref:PspC domain-containing protein n=1 Tax=Leucobacter denitrificans TaxID=683042 RepID=A0A7G9S3U0_9MICO|nr:ATP-binding protein [Leucobacter denitrificans]QNN62515.1 PspC domain-containing protein [Leucobacter denitrificans]